MASRLPPFTRSHSSSLLTWPLEKYSYSVSPISSSTEVPWTHFAHRDNVFLVIDTQRLASRLKHDGSFVAQQIRLKVIWGADTLEDVDLTNLTRQKIPGLTPAAPAQPAVMALGRSPCLAIKYINREEGTFRRFQLRLASDHAFQAAKMLLERSNCPVKMTGPRSSEQLYQAQLFVPPSYQGTNFSQTTCRGYGEPRFQVPEPSYATQSRQPITPPPNLYYNPNIFSQSQNVPKSSLAAKPSSSNFNQIGTQEPTPPLSSHSSQFSFSCPNHLESDANADEGLPPPRPPPSLSSFGKSAMQRSQPVKSILSGLPPLRKPTPVSKPPPSAAPAPPLTPRKLSMVSPGAAAMAYHTPTTLPTPSKSRIRSKFGSGSLQQSFIAEHGKAGTGRAQSLAGIAEYYRNSTLPADSGTESESAIAGNVNSEMPCSKTDCTGTSKKLTTEATNCGEKRKFQEDETFAVESGRRRKQSKGKDAQTEKESQDREFLELERLVVDAIHDDEFVKFVEKVGKVWQRAGFDAIDGKGLYGIGLGKRLRNGGQNGGEV